MQELGLMERFADPALFESLTFGEKISGGLVTTLMGMGTTFVILTILWFIIAMTSKLIIKSEAKAKTALETPAAAPVAAPAAPAPVAEAQASNDELVAVLMAAIAASAGQDYVNKLRISKISRVSGSRPAWNMAGSADLIDSRKI